MRIKVDKYPNEYDYKPYIDKYAPDEMIELPLSDPSESHTTNAFKSSKANMDEQLKPSAFNVNMSLKNKELKN